MTSGDPALLPLTLEMRYAYPAQVRPTPSDA